MPFPRKLSFETTRFPDGFIAEGLCKPRKRIKSPDGEMVGPIAGGLFACLDDPEAVDARRMRLQPGRAKRFNGLRVRSQRSQVPTLGADGACLSYPGVHLKKGERLVFGWHFMSWSELPWNDFAVFEAIADDSSGYGLAPHVLCDLAELVERSHPRYASGWCVTQWELLHDFSGTLAWTVANGQEVTDPAMIDCEPEAFANPGALLLDDIRVYR